MDTCRVQNQTDFVRASGIRWSLFVCSTNPHFPTSPVTFSSHWEQGVIYPAGPLWVHCGFWSNSPSCYPLGTWLVLCESTHHNTQWVLFGRTPWLLLKSGHQSAQWVLFGRTPWFLSQSTHQSAQQALCERNPWVLSQFTLKSAHQVPEPLIKSSFINCSEIWPQFTQPHTQRVNWEFVEKQDYIESFLWVNWKKLGGWVAG